jgi:RNA polymerase sigma-70 factor (ECF subfamily)
VNNNELAQKLNAIRNGDKIAFEEIYKDLRTPIFTIINRITWDRVVSEDILQEVFVKLFLSPPDPLKNPRAYIFQIARNLAIDSVRKQKPNISLDEISETVHQPLEDFSLQMDIDDALKSLPAQECEIVTLHVIGGLTFREIAEVTKTPSGTVKWKYQKAISKLQKILSGGITQ